RMLAVGLLIFTASSAAAALAPSAGALIAARAAQGVGGAIVTPLTLTILSAGVPANRRGAFIGAWSGIAALAGAFGPLVWGSIFLLSQFFQTVQGYSPLGSGLRILPWTIMPMFVAPVAGALSDRIGGARLMGIGLTLQASGLASLAAISTPTTPYWQLVAPFMVSGIGMAM